MDEIAHPPFFLYKDAFTAGKCIFEKKQDHAIILHYV